MNGFSLFEKKRIYILNIKHTTMIYSSIFLFWKRKRRVAALKISMPFTQFLSESEE